MRDDLEQRSRAAPEAERRERSRGRRWLFFLIALIAVPMAIQVFLVLRAVEDPSFAVEPDYYRRSLAWDEVMAQERLNARLGWQIALTTPLVSRPGPSSLSVSLLDRAGKPLSGATIRVEAFAVARAGQVLRAVLTPVAVPGQYQALLVLERPGRWELRFTAELGGVTYTQTLRANLLSHEVAR
jgi:nitrogen fixation protein FixH